MTELIIELLPEDAEKLIQAFKDGKLTELEKLGVMEIKLAGPLEPAIPKDECQIVDSAKGKSLEKDDEPPSPLP